MRNLQLLFLLFFCSNILYSQQINTFDENVFDSIKTSDSGKVILLNIYAEWCNPCTEEFPDLIKLQNNYKDKNFAMVLVNCDKQTALDPKVKPFLKKQGVTFITYNSSHADLEIFLNKFKLKHNGIPKTLIFDKRGLLKTVFKEKTEYEDFEDAVLELL